MNKVQINVGGGYMVEVGSQGMAILQGPFTTRQPVSPEAFGMISAAIDQWQAENGSAFNQGAEWRQGNDAASRAGDDSARPMPLDAARGANDPERESLVDILCGLISILDTIEKSPAIGRLVQEAWKIIAADMTPPDAPGAAPEDAGRDGIVHLELTMNGAAELYAFLTMGTPKCLARSVIAQVRDRLGAKVAALGLATHLVYLDDRATWGIKDGLMPAEPTGNGGRR